VLQRVRVAAVQAHERAVLGRQLATRAVERSLHRLLQLRDYPWRRPPSARGLLFERGTRSRKTLLRSAKLR